MIEAKRGFTLIEVVVVMAIIAVLATLVVGAINVVRKQARNTQRINDLKNFKTALEVYYIKAKDYQVSGEQVLITPCYREPFNDSDFVAAWTAAGMATPPTDPGGSNQYVIHTSSDKQKYILLAQLEGGGPQTASDITSLLTQLGITGWTPCAEYNYAVSNL